MKIIPCTLIPLLYSLGDLFKKDIRKISGIITYKIMEIILKKNKKGEIVFIPGLI